MEKWVLQTKQEAQLSSVNVIKSLKPCLLCVSGGLGRDPASEGGGQQVHGHPQPGGGVRDERPAAESGKAPSPHERS